jgi:hypothetical protein
MLHGKKLDVKNLVTLSSMFLSIQTKKRKKKCKDPISESNHSLYSRLDTDEDEVMVSA